MSINISKKNEIDQYISTIHYSCFLTYDAESMARKLSRAYPAKWKSYEIETEPVTSTGGVSTLSYQMFISEGKHKPMILITPHTSNNIFSDYLDDYGEGFHHNCIIFEKIEEYKIHLTHLIESGFTKVQSSTKLTMYESCILNHPKAEFMFQLLFLNK